MVPAPPPQWPYDSGKDGEKRMLLAGMRKWYTGHVYTMVVGIAYRKLSTESLFPVGGM